MTTLTIVIPDDKTDHISSIIEKEGGNIIAKVTDEGLTKKELKLLKKGIKEAKLIEQGKLKAYTFDELWD
jgi:hypothetical protein